MARAGKLTIASIAIGVAAGVLVLGAAVASNVTQSPAPGEDRPGGAATSRHATTNANAFSHASSGIGFAGEFRFKLGNALFRKAWVSSPSSTEASDGLGPLFNARACQSCHLKDGRGHPPAANWPDDDAVSMFLRLSIPPQTDADRAALASNRVNVIPEPTYGGQLQDIAAPGHAGEGRMHIRYEDVVVTLGDGERVTLRKPHYTITDLAYGPMHKDAMLSPRVAPQMIGLGLLQAIPEADILARADPDDRDGNGISGRPNRVFSVVDQKVMLGRFGHKAGNPTVRQQSAGAFAGDIGIGNPLAPEPYGDCTANQPTCRAAPPRQYTPP